MLRIAEARDICGWSQERLAAAVGTTQQTIQRWETGQVDPKVSKILDISRALGVTVSYLLGTDNVSNSDLLTDEERELAALYRSANAQGRAGIMALARSQAGMEGKFKADMSA